MRTLYGRNIVLPAVNGDVLFNRVDIFGAAWAGAFGYPFGQASLGGGDLAIGGSFGCNSPTSVVTGYGTITAIGANYVECANGNGTKQRFNLGSCSRLEATKQLPRVGQKFFWSGVPASQGYNVYAASCLDWKWCANIYWKVLTFLFLLCLGNINWNRMKKCKVYYFFGVEA